MQLNSNNSVKNLLIIAFWFPPTNVIGAVRVGKFAKYLPTLGWNPIVLTVDKILRDIPSTLPVEMDTNNIFRTPYFGIADYITSILARGKEKGPNISNQPISFKKAIYRQLVKSLKKIYHLPALKLITTDPVGWYYYGLKKALQIIRHYNIDAIFSSYWPSTAHIIASELQKKTGIPWIADFRDLWSLEPYYPKTQPFQFIEECIEKKVINRSSILTTTSLPWAQKLESLHAKRVSVIHNGFDADDYDYNTPLTSKFTLTHTGNIQAWDSRQLNDLFLAIKRLWQNKEVGPETFELRFYGGNIDGTGMEELKQKISHLGITNLVKIYGQVPFKDSINKQKESSALLLSRASNDSAKGTYSAKVFEYLGAGRPIIAIALKGDVIDELLRSTSSGKLVNGINEIYLLLSKWIKEFQHDKNIITEFKPKQMLISRYTRRFQTEQLVDILNRIGTNKESSLNNR